MNNMLLPLEISIHIKQKQSKLNLDNFTRTFTPTPATVY